MASIDLSAAFDLVNIDLLILMWGLTIKTFLNWNWNPTSFFSKYEWEKGIVVKRGDCQLLLLSIERNKNVRMESQFNSNSRSRSKWDTRKDLAQVYGSDSQLMVMQPLPGQVNVHLAQLKKEQASSLLTYTLCVPYDQLSIWLVLIIVIYYICLWALVNIIWKDSLFTLITKIFLKSFFYVHAVKIDTQDTQCSLSTYTHI